MYDNSLLALNFADLGVANKSADDWYCILRNVQSANCLPHILDGSFTHQIDSTDFERDILFCAWTYFVDWEKKEVLVHSGSREIDEACSFAGLSEEWMNELETRGQEE